MEERPKLRMINEIVNLECESSCAVVKSATCAHIYIHTVHVQQCLYTRYTMVTSLSSSYVCMCTLQVDNCLK